jgi:diaminopimelate epimerase
LEVTDGRVSKVTVDMGIVSGTGSGCVNIDSAERQIVYEGVDIGNPHAVVFLEDDPGLLTYVPLRQAGMAVQNSDRFPDGVNVEFIEVAGRNEIRMRVWERGSGETFACGTGTCATVVASVLNGHTDEHVTVHLLGGDLELFYDRANDTVWMTGPATTVFEGETKEEF